MVAKESYNQDPMEESHDMQELDEAEDTLSFCDLPIYSDAVDWEDFSKEYQTYSSSSSPSDQENYFEFFSEERNPTPTTQNIIFCGKIIPYNDPISVHDQLQSNQQQKSRNQELFRRNSNSFNKSKTSKSNSTKSAKARCRNPNASKHGFSVERLSILTPPTKSRWYLYMFGLARFPMKMDLSDMKTRQNRQGPSTLFRWDGGDGKLAVGKSRSVKGLWGLIKDISCGGNHHANTVVKASFGCIPRV